MALVQITSADAEKVARAFADMIGKDGLKRIQRKAVTDVGSRIRKDARSVAPSLFGTALANLRIQGRAPSRGADNPAYKLYMASSFPVGKLRSPLRKVSKGELTIRPPHQSTQRFRAVERIGRAFKLLRAGPLPSRFLGGIATGAGRAFADADDGGQAELAALRRKAEKDLPAAATQAINDFMKRRTK